MIMAGSFFDAPLRRALRQQVALTVPEQHVDKVVDVALHAAEQSLETLERLCFSHPSGPVGTTAASIAVSVLIHRLTMVKEAFNDAAKATGLPVHHATVRVQS